MARTKAQRSAAARKAAGTRKRNLEELKKQNEKLESEVTKFKDENKNFSDKVETLQNENTRLSGTNTGLEGQVTRLKNELDNVWKKPQNWGLAAFFGAITGLAVYLIITALSS